MKKPCIIVVCNLCHYLGRLITCSELTTVNIHAKTTVSSLTANRPNTQVKPNTGNRITAAFADALKTRNCTWISKYEVARNISMHRNSFLYIYLKNFAWEDQSKN